MGILVGVGNTCLEVIQWYTEVGNKISNRMRSSSKAMDIANINMATKINTMHTQMVTEFSNIMNYHRTVQNRITVLEQEHKTLVEQNQQIIHTLQNLVTRQGGVITSSPADEQNERVHPIDNHDTSPEVRVVQVLNAPNPPTQQHNLNDVLSNLAR